MHAVLINATHWCTRRGRGGRERQKERRKERKKERKEERKKEKQNALLCYRKNERKKEKRQSHNGPIWATICLKFGVERESAQRPTDTLGPERAIVRHNDALTVSKATSGKLLIDVVGCIWALPSA